MASTPGGVGLDDRINALVAPVSDGVAGWVFASVPVAGTSVPLIVGWLIVAGVVFTVRFGFIQWRGFRHALHLTRGDYTDPQRQGPGETTHFQALTMALSGTVGLGNIAGVAVAVSLGGPGATFWMIVAGLLGMVTKFTECVLGVKYRRHHADGTVSGGPMHYLSRGLAERGRPRLGRALAAIFAVCCVGGAFGGGNMFQANQAFGQVMGVLGGDAGPLAGRGWLFGLLLAGVLAVVVVGGAQSIARTTSRLVPLMAAIYLGGALVVLAVHVDRIPWALGQIVLGAFTPEGVAGGAIGALIQGFKRAAFSNEAGIGSAAIAHSTVRTHEPVSEGYVALLEPFIDTVVICTTTALVIVITGSLASDLTGVQLTSAAFGSVIAWFPLVLAVAVVLFAFSTMVTWFYYGLKSWTYLLGRARWVVGIYQALFLACVVLGSSTHLGPVIDFSDAMIFIMAIPNVIGLYLLMPVVRHELAAYEERRRTGEVRSHRRGTQAVQRPGIR